jgi:hypothetical protein
LFDFGVPFRPYQQLKDKLTLDLSSEDDSYYSQMVEYMLSTPHLEEWLEKPGRIHVFWESKKA